MDKALSSAKPQSRLKPDPWSATALLISLVVLAPIVAVGTLALFPSENIWPHLLATTLPRYLGNTLVLMAGVGLLAALVGTGAAWLIARYEFPLARWFEWLLLLPLAVPAYVGAYALVDLLEYAGPVQTALRAAFGWESARDYWFPEIRSLGSAIIVLAAALYPYVYLLARAAFHEQSGASEEVAMSLGQGALRRLRRIG
ncbi:ABC transporter permease, partial [Lentibacter algarum]